MKNLIIFSMLAVMAVINFSGCGKAQERPTKLSKKISGEVVELKELADITKDERQDSPENMAFKRQLVNKIEDPAKREQAELLLSQNRLVYMLMDGKAVILEFIPSMMNKHAEATPVAETAGTSETAKVDEGVAKVSVLEVKKLHTYDSLMAMKDGRNSNEIETLKASSWSQNHFAVLSEIEIQTGVLESERTDYNEKKSTLGLTETSLAEAQVLILKSEIKTETAAKDDASGAE
ncbi:hypothetical protein [Pseudobdellovibrio sp. HCB154]|uniref:hypothetical protein n=1 Tax=Pseudobdellovibrio sp. HCB154 TaxID=3386277 RepID=UPI0039170C10